MRPYFVVLAILSPWQSARKRSVGIPVGLEVSPNTWSPNKENAHAYTQASTIAFKGFDEIGDFLNLKTIANAILQYFAPNINKVFDMDRGSGLEYCLLFNQINRRTTAKIFFRYTTTIIASTIQKPLICVCCHHVNSRSTGTAFSTILSLYTRLSR